jgi:catechol 2,3-dioxygenase-like lactoylglutathione lyase family enzyme
VEVLSSRVHVAARDFERSRGFYEETLGLKVYREFGTNGRVTGVVFFCGGGFLELGEGGSGVPPPDGIFLWLQVDDVQVEHDRLVAAGVGFDEPPERRSWGLVEAWLRDPDGLRIALVEVPPDHPLRRRVD